MKHITLTITILAFIFLFSCTDNKLNIDVSKIDVEINIKRLDKDLIENYPDTANILSLVDKYGMFLELYSQGVLQIGSPNQKDFSKKLFEFNKYCFETGIPQKINTVFPNTDEIDKELRTNPKPRLRNKLKNMISVMRFGSENRRDLFYVCVHI